MTDFNEEQDAIIEQRLTEKLNKFREGIRLIADEVIGDVYFDILPYMITDTEANVSNRATGVIKNLIAGKFKDISTENLSPYISVEDGYGMSHYIHFSQYSDLIEPIWNTFKDQFESVRIAQLESEVERLKEHLQQAYRQI